MIDNNREINELGAASHFPVLMACAMATSAPILEIGAGHCSTNLLHALCCPHRRRLVTMEDKQEWRDWFSPWARDGHEIIEHNPENIARLALEKWGVVLVDDSPGPPRVENVLAFLDNADYVVVHDAQGEDIMGPMRPVIAGIPHQIHKTYFPWTLVISKTRPLPLVPFKSWGIV